MLNQSIIHLWHTKLDDHSKKYLLYQSWLASNEKIRAQKLAFPYRQNFVISRGILRDLLAYYSKKYPEKLKLNYSDSGKPIFDKKSKVRIEFNLSHSKDILVCVFTIGTPVGIDIEYINPISHLDKIAYRFLPAYEYDQLQVLQGSNKLQIFFKAWVRNEALIKAKGNSLQTHLSSRYKRSLETELNTSIFQQTEINSVYTISNLFLYPNFATAIAVKGNEKPIIIKEYTKRMSEIK